MGGISPGSSCCTRPSADQLAQRYLCIRDGTRRCFRVLVLALDVELAQAVGRNVELVVQLVSSDRLFVVDPLVS